MNFLRLGPEPLRHGTTTTERLVSLVVWIIG